MSQSYPVPGRQLTIFRYGTPEPCRVCEQDIREGDVCVYEYKYKFFHPACAEATQEETR